jgi:hypothetical protein
VHTCPHCNERGVAFSAKLLSSPLHPAKCRLCGGFSTRCPSVVLLQIALAILFPAVVPHVYSVATARQLGGIVAGVIILIGQLGPLCKTLDT